MKQLILLFVFSSSVLCIGQKRPEKCNDLPYAKVDEKAALISNTKKQLKVSVPADMKKGEYNASIKCYVDCDGVMDKVTYHKGNFTDDQQVWLLDVINDCEWTPAIKDNLYVTSTVFLQVEMKNGNVSVSVF